MHQTQIRQLIKDNQPIIGSQIIHMINRMRLIRRSRELDNKQMQDRTIIIKASHTRGNGRDKTDRTLKDKNPMTLQDKDRTTRQDKDHTTQAGKIIVRMLHDQRTQEHGELIAKGILSKVIRTYGKEIITRGGNMIIKMRTIVMEGVQDIQTVKITVERETTIKSTTDDLGRDKEIGGRDNQIDGKDKEIIIRSIPEDEGEAATVGSSDFIAYM